MQVRPGVSLRDPRRRCGCGPCVAVTGRPPRPGRSTVKIDCDTCVVRGDGCGGCVVTALLGAPPAGVELDDDEAHALDVLAAAALVPRLRLVRPQDDADVRRAAS